MKIKMLTYISLFTAIMGILGLMPPLPITPVPVTLQTLGVMLAGSVLGARLGPKYAAYSQILFLLLVAIGLPLLAGGRGGIGAFFTPAGGFTIGWVFGAFVIGYICYRMKEMKLWKIILANIVGGILVVYAFGIPIMAFVLQISVIEAAFLNMAFLPGDFIKVALASLLAVRLQKAIPLVSKKSDHAKIA